MNEDRFTKSGAFPIFLPFFNIIFLRFQFIEIFLNSNNLSSCLVLSTYFSDYYMLYAYMLSQFRKTKPQHVNNSQVSKVSVRLAPGGWSATVPLIGSPDLSEREPINSLSCVRTYVRTFVCSGPIA